MKRKAAESIGTDDLKRQKAAEPDYCDADPQTDGDGTVIWPAQVKAIEDARDFLRTWFG